MNYCYIGVGGIGCRLLKKYSEDIKTANYRFIYIDAIQDDLNILNVEEKYALTSQYSGGKRTIGKDVIKTVIYTGQMPEITNAFLLNDELELVFVTTTFGGFGSAVVSEMADYYATNIGVYRKNHNVVSKFNIRVIAFSLSCIGEELKFPTRINNLFCTNEIEFINEFRIKEYRQDKWYIEHSNRIPYIELIVPNCNGEELYKIIGLSNDQLSKIDTKKNYYLKPDSLIQPNEVFISYSSKDQYVADLMVDVANKNGIECWIATSSIEAGSYAKQIVQGIKRAKVMVVIVSENSILSPHVKNELDVATSRINDGLVIMPFKIDEFQLDDECRYYLGRQEFFMGEKPPIEERVEQFIDKIKKVLNK